MVKDAHAPQPGSPSGSGSSDLDHNNAHVHYFDYSAYPDDGTYFFTDVYFKGAYIVHTS